MKKKVEDENINFDNIEVDSKSILTFSILCGFLYGADDDNDDNNNNNIL